MGYGFSETRARRLPLLEGIDLALAQSATLCHDYVAVFAIALARYLAHGHGGPFGSHLRLLALQDGQSLLCLVHDGDLDLGKRRQLLHEIFLIQADDEGAHVGDDGGGAGNVHEDADFAKESAGLQLCICALLVPRGHAHSTADQPVHGLARLAFGENSVMRLVQLGLEMQADLCEERVRGGLEQREGAQAVEQV